MGAGEFFPDENAKFIAESKPARILDLLMFANTIEAQLLDQFDISAQCRHVGSSESAVGPVSLVKSHPKGEQLTIQPYASTLNRHGADPHIAFNRVGLTSADVLDGGIDQSGPIGAPENARRILCGGRLQIECSGYLDALVAHFHHSDPVVDQLPRALKQPHSHGVPGAWISLNLCPQ